LVPACFLSAAPPKRKHNIGCLTAERGNCTLADDRVHGTLQKELRERQADNHIVPPEQRETASRVERCLQPNRVKHIPAVFWNPSRCKLPTEEILNPIFRASVTKT